MLTRRAFVGGVAATTVLAANRVPARSTDVTGLTLTDASALIRTRKLSPRDLALAYLDRIEALNPKVNAYITVLGERALEEAGRLEAELAAGRWRGPLHGLPIALKDNIDTAGVRTTAASAVLAERVPEADAEVVRRLKAAGAVLLGKLNMHEFAYGGTSSISHFGPVHNPWNLAHIPGGSSGGSAAAVAAGMCGAALGTDTLASIRLPAAYCGIVGFKPTHGLSSIRGIIPVAETLDHVGPMARSVADCALLLQAMAGYDAADPVSIEARLPDYARALQRSVAEMRLGVPRTVYFEGLDPDIAGAVETALDVLSALTAGTRDVDLPPHPDFPVLLAEAHAWHRAYLDDPSNHSRYDPVTLARLQAAGGFTTDDYIGVRRELVLARRSIDRVFEAVDLLVTPTAPGLPETIEHAVNPAQSSGAEPSVRNTLAFNVFGIPVISVPCGFSRSGLPIGLQIIGPRLGEVLVLALAHAYEQATDWHRRQPPLS